MSDTPTQMSGAGGPRQRAEEDFVALKPGQVIGRYEIVSILGQGGFGITYRARDTQLGRDVAIKEYLPSALAIRQDGSTVLPRNTKMAEDFSWGRERFVSEGRTMATLHRAPAIVHVFDYLEANGTAYIVMELLQGETLEHRIIRDGKLEAKAVDKILWPLLDGLEQVHSAGFLHRDIKPGNILLNSDGNPTLIDFGASRAAMAGRTTAMTAIFTPGYAAAEQMTSARQGPWTDIYGLSATLYHAITGSTPPSAFDRMMEDTYRPLARLAPAGYAPGVLAGIDAGLAVVASDRPQSIAGWRPILGMASAPTGDATLVMQKAAGAGRAKVARQPTAGAGGRSSPRLLLGMAASVVLALLLGGGGYYMLATRGPDPEMVKARAAAAAAEAEAAKLRADKAAQEKVAAEAALKKQVEEETRQKIAAEAAAKQKAEQDAAAALAEEQKRLAEAAEARRKAAEFITGNFDHFGRTLVLIGLVGQPDQIHLQGVDIVDDPALRDLAISALATQARHLRCRQTDRLTDGTPLYRCLITPLNAKPPLDQIPDSERNDLALALVRNGLVLASCDAPRSYADAEDDARGRGQSLWGRVKVQDYKKRCSK